jgi:hypothetical protein
MIRIGILSLAHHHGEAYISNLRSMEGVGCSAWRMMTAAIKPLPGKTRRGIFTYEDLLDETRWRDHLHREQPSPPACRDGCRRVHILCEKPSPRPRSAIVDACDKAGVL